MRETDCVVLCTTLPAGADAAALSRTLVAERLAACVTTQPGIRSVYRWQGAIEEDEEQQVLIKTTVDRVELLGDRIRELHPYEVPELLVLPVTGGGAAYLEWIRTCTAAAADR